jgi:hypothetical protein
MSTICTDDTWLAVWKNPEPLPWEKDRWNGASPMEGLIQYELPLWVFRVLQLETPAPVV